MINHEKGGYVGIFCVVGVKTYKREIGNFKNTKKRGGSRVFVQSKDVIIINDGVIIYLNGKER